MTAGPPPSVIKASSIDLLDIKSKAPIPSMESTVDRGFSSVNNWNACATHSVVAHEDNAYWDGAVAASTTGITCCAIVRATDP